MLEDYLFTKKTNWLIWGTSGVILTALIFHAGIVVGSHQNNRRASYQGASGDQGGMMQNFMPRQGYMESGHGAVGTIATVTLPTFIITTRDGAQQSIYAATGTVVTGGTAQGPSALTSGQFVVIIGDPDDSDDKGYLDARIIHILPPPPTR